MEFLDIQKEIVPEMTKLLEKRYEILRHIYFDQPVGRRGLANRLNVGERVIRTEVNVLKEQGLLTVEPVGMYLTQEGKVILNELNPLMKDIRGISKLENSLKEILGVKNVVVVAEDSSENELSLRDLGKASAEELRKSLKEDYIVGVTGGTTMSYLAKEVKVEKLSKNILFTPARGGLGGNVETQANSIAAQIANKLSAEYNLLHIPDDLDEETMKAILKDKKINEIVQKIDEIDLLVFGLGRADEMAKRRNLDTKQYELLIKKAAVSEAFGHFFDIEGCQIWESPTIGMSLEKFKKIPNVIAVAGGRNKAEAIISISSIRKDITLITDEGAAKEIEKILL